MERKIGLLTLIGVLLLSASAAWAQSGYYVIAGGGPSGKVLKTQVFTSDSINSTLGTGSWSKLASPQWTYTKVSPTSYLVITYRDSISCVGGYSFYQLRVNDQPSVAGENAARLLCNANDWNMSEATGVWTGLPKGNVNLSIWHLQAGCTACTQNNGGFTTTVTVMEIEH